MSLKQHPLSCKIIINTQGAKLNLNWHDMRINFFKKQSGYFLLHSGAWQLLSDTCHIKGQRKPDIWVCACTCMCVYICLCMTDALLIKLMDFVRTLLCLQSPISPLSFALCSQLLKQSIHSSSKYFLLTSQEKSIMGQRGEKLGIVEGGSGWQREKKKKDQG